MRAILFCFLFLFWSLPRTCHAQNLVPNPSFEEMYSCPTSSDQVDSCIGWFSALNTPDYFALCAPYPVSIPDNFVGYQLPFHGSSYIGLITYEWWQFYREIIGTQLSSQLMKGNKYSVSLRVSRGNWTNQNYNCSASNRLGIRFTTYPYSSSNPPSINNYAQVYSDSIIEDTLNWVLLNWKFTADSAYKYIYIGNFFDDAHTDTTIINAPLGQFGTAYYYIDSVQLFCDDQSCINSISELEGAGLSFIYDAGLKTLAIISDFDQHLSCAIYSYSGQLIKHMFLGDNSTISFRDLPPGLYIVQVKTVENFYSKKIFIH